MVTKPQICSSWSQKKAALCGLSSEKMEFSLQLGPWALADRLGRVSLVLNLLSGLDIHPTVPNPNCDPGAL